MSDHNSPLPPVERCPLIGRRPGCGAVCRYGDLKPHGGVVDGRCLTKAEALERVHG